MYAHQKRTSTKALLAASHHTALVERIYRGNRRSGVSSFG